jgi:hypothetical protein
MLLEELAQLHELAAQFDKCGTTAALLADVFPAGRRSG